jgi:hypothetical protein
MAADISFSLGIANFLSVAVLSLVLASGLNMGGNDNWGGVSEWLSFGSFLAMGVMIVYIGRRYYWHTLREAVTFRRQPDTEPSGVWACRAFLACSFGVVAILTAVGLDPVLAVLAIGLILLTFVVCARMNAECGVFYYLPTWAMPGALAGLYGLNALGPVPIVVIGLTWYMLIWMGIECMMPFAVTGLKVASDTGLTPGRTGLAFAAVILVVMVLIVPTGLWADYNHAPPMDRGGTGAEIYGRVEKVVSQLSVTGDLEKVKHYTSWERLKNLQPESGFLAASAVGFGLLLAFSALRMRFNWWPLHPVLLLWLSASTYVGRFSLSFLLGWAVKTAVVRLGGRRHYEAGKRLMIGVVLGDLAGGFTMMLVSWVYFAATGKPGMKFMLW